MSKKIVLSSNTSWSIYDFRLNLIRTLKEKGYEVIIVAPYDKYSEFLKKEFECNVDIYDPWADADDVKRMYNIDLIEHSKLKIQNYNAVVLAVAHDKFKKIENEIRSLKAAAENSFVIYDIKGFFDKELVDERL